MGELELIAVRVKDGIFIGNAAAAEDGEFLGMNKITHIVNCTGGEIENLFSGDPEFKYISFPWGDTPGSVCATILFDPHDENINCAVKFIDEAVDSGNCVLVHSYYGISRSPTLVAAYLMIKYSWKLESALSFLHMSHPDMLIKPYFLRQLRLFAKRHNIDYDIFDKEVDDSEFGLDNDQWMLRNTFLNGLCFQEQQLHELYRECTAKVDIGTRVYAERKKLHVSFVANAHRKNLGSTKSISVVNTNSARYLDPNADTSSDNLIGLRGLIALSTGDRSLSIMSRSVSPCARKLESNPATGRKGRGLCGLESEGNNGINSFYTAATTMQNFTRSNRQFSFLRNGGDASKDHQPILTVACEEPLHISTVTSSSNLPNYERLAPPKSSTSSHHSPYARLTPKHIYRKGSPLPIQNTTQTKVSRVKHFSMPPFRPFRNSSPSSADTSASNQGSTQKINALGSLISNGSASPTSLAIRTTSTIVRSTSSDYISIAPRRVVLSSSGKTAGSLHVQTNNRPMVTRRHSPSARIPQVLTKSRSPCSKPGSPSSQNELSPRFIRKKGNDSTLTESTRRGTCTGAGKMSKVNSSIASVDLGDIVAKKPPSLSAPCSGTLRCETRTSIPSRQK